MDSEIGSWILRRVEAARDDIDTDVIVIPEGALHVDRTIKRFDLQRDARLAPALADQLEAGRHRVVVVIDDGAQAQTCAVE
jgi:hypothetical protein